MRTLIDYFIEGGLMAAIQTPTTGSVASAPVDDTGYVHSVVANLVSGSMDAETTLQLEIDLVNTGLIVVLPILALNAGVLMRVNGTSAHVVPGNELTLRTLGETTPAASIRITYIIRRN